MQIQGRSDESKVRKRLRKIADLPLRLRIVFFRQQADIVANRQQALEQGGRFGVAVLQRVIVGKPKAAREKYPFSRSQTINAGLGSITKYEPVDRELLLDSRNGAAHAWIFRRQEADERHQQQTRIELAASEALREGVAAAVESKLTNRRVHVVANSSPPFQRRHQFETLRIPHRAIQSNPCHDLG